LHLHSDLQLDMEIHADEIQTSAWKLPSHYDFEHI